MVFLYLYEAAFSISYAASKPIPKVYTGPLFLFESSNGNRAEIHELRAFIDPLKKTSLGTRYFVDGMALQRK